MFKDKEFILHLIGLVVLSALAIFFTIIEAKYNKEITDVGLIVGSIASLVGARTANSLIRSKKEPNNE